LYSKIQFDRRLGKRNYSNNKNSKQNALIYNKSKLKKDLPGFKNLGGLSNYLNVRLVFFSKESLVNNPG